MVGMRTEVAIVGAGPAGLLLAHLLAQDGIESVVVETRSRDYVESRIRAGILESSTVELLDAVGLGTRLHDEGDLHRGIHLQWPGERHHLDFVDLVGRGVWVYGQTEVQKDLGRARDAAGQRIVYEVADTAVHDPTGRPHVTFTVDGRPERLDAEVVVGCDGSFGPSRGVIPAAVTSTWTRTYPYSWLGVLADVAPSTDELIYAWHPNGFALHSMRSATVSRLYLQVPNETDLAEWPDERIWAELAERIGPERVPGPITEKSVLPMRSYVLAPMRHGRLFLAGDAAHIVPPTGAKGMNLAVSDVRLLAAGLDAFYRRGSSELLDRYTDDALKRIWRAEYFSWWMTSMLHTFADASPFQREVQRAELENVVNSRALSTALAENYVGAF
jgi:p-hydroxybenzoate 3-monooxygenase